MLDCKTDLGNQEESMRIARPNEPEDGLYWAKFDTKYEDPWYLLVIEDGEIIDAFEYEEPTVLYQCETYEMENLQHRLDKLELHKFAPPSLNSAESVERDQEEHMSWHQKNIGNYMINHLS